jgi:serine/threonine protein kinase
MSNPPPRIAHYVVRHELGSGGMGVVYAAYDPKLDRTVAVKLLRPDYGDESRVERGNDRLLSEARAMAQLSHPHVVPVYEVGEYEGSVFIAMEFVDGLAADDWLADCARPYREVLSAFFQAGLGLAAAHESGMVHRDFKPANILVGNDHRVRVVDFGLARATPMEPDEGMLMDTGDVESTTPGSDHSVTHPTTMGLTAGTPAYMAPEQFDGRVAGAAADQFAYCVSLYEALYGERPFAGRTAFAVAENMLAGRVKPEPGISRVPGWLRNILLRGLLPDPENRFPSMKSLLAAIAFTDRVLRH